MKRIAFAAVFTACVGVAGVASAADLSLKDTPSYSYSPAALWTGLYIGGHIGGAWGGVDVTDTYTYGGDPTKKFNFSPNGLIGGVQLGYNRQSGHLVYGIEGDLGGLGLSGSKSAHLQDFDINVWDPVWDTQHALDAKYSVSGGLYGDITGRLGYTTNNSLFYLKGGAAFLNVDVSANYTGGNCTTQHLCDYALNYSKFNYDGSDTLWGWTIGAGVEYSLSPSISLKAEYQHFDFGSMSLDHNGTYRFCTTCPAGWKSKLSGTADTSITADAVTVGLNYHLNGGDPLK